MTRKIITIDEALCNGCGLCVSACHEGALKLVDGKAKLVSESYCDGLGACLPECPTGAIKIVERDAAAFDEAAVAAKQAAEKATVSSPAPLTPPLACGCPGKMAKAITRPPAAAQEATPAGAAAAPESRLVNWPVQIKLVPISAPYLKNAALLIAADCTAFAYAEAGGGGVGWTLPVGGGVGTGVAVGSGVAVGAGSNVTGSLSTEATISG